MGTFREFLIIRHSRNLGIRLMHLPSYGGGRITTSQKILFTVQAVKWKIAFGNSLGFYG